MSLGIKDVFREELIASLVTFVAQYVVRSTVRGLGFVGFA